jgi:hypothetical protein
MSGWTKNATRASTLSLKPWLELSGQLADRQLITQASFHRLTEQIDRFLRGRSGNRGQRQD